MSRESGICLTDMSGSEGTKIRVQMSTASSATEFDKIMTEVRAYVRAKGIMLEDKFLECDCLRKGYVTGSDFGNVCKEVFQEILNDEQIKEVQTQYYHPEVPHHCNWSRFMHDAEPEANAELASSESSKDRVQKKEVLKRVAQSLKQRVDTMNLLEKLSSSDVSGNEVDDDEMVTQDKLFQLLGETTEKDDLRIIREIYTDKMGFKYQEFVTDLKLESQCFSLKHSRPLLRNSNVSPCPTKSSMEIADDQANSTTNPRFSGVQRDHRQFSISYEALIWTVFLLLTTLCIVDHFVLKGDVVLGRGGKRPKLIWGTNIGETATNIVWAVTARLIITSQNLMFYTMLWCFPNFLSEIAPKWIRINGIRDVHVRIHRFAGIFLIAIPSLAHVLVIFVPPLVDGTALKYYPPSMFNYSSSPDHLNWSTFWDPAAVHGWTFNDHTGVHLTADEIYRFVLMIVLFCIFFPLSRSQYVNRRSYSLAMALHVFAGIWYAADNIRKITHGLSHVANLPLLMLWCLDRLLSICVYRHQRAKIERKEIIGNNEYLVVFIKLGKEVTHNVGDVYYTHHFMEKNVGLAPQRSHPFTTFSNLSNDRTWDIGLVISIMEDTEQLFLPWTSWLARKDNSSFTNIHTWGPYRSSVSSLYDDIAEELEGRTPPSHYVLFATGSGCGYLLDVLSFLAYRAKPHSQQERQSIKRSKIEIFYSVRCKAFFQYFRQQIEELLRQIKNKDIIDISFQFYVTNPDDQPLRNETEDTEIQLIHGRINFERALKSATKRSRCYFVGRPAIAEKIEEICLKKGIGLTKDYTNGQGEKQDRPLLLKYLKISFWVMFFIAAVCIVVGLVIDVRAIKGNLNALAPVTNNMSKVSHKSGY
ncbi:hypothetical protein P5673_030931 [Acropora cervicornis]|uniref:Ferric reductase NAD binding domain-containing protein n=1 Tax=Acropora cervicornis TaxID=6130 RepID=A0AAD9PTW0_ACRCE|nr:hypothetical protein P5673_030931 [Acropora cervicornis]